MTRRALLCPEVVQTSEMDCGPAVLTALLAGFGIRVSYGRLREACQTGVDGTSIDVIEDVAVQLGLDAGQVLVPADHVLLRGAEQLPAIVVVRQPSGLTHFVLLWRRHGPWVQVMDPAAGRRWLPIAEVERMLYVHEARVPAEAWRQWAGSDDFRRPLALRLRRAGVAGGEALLDAALADPDWRGAAALDAVTRMVASLVDAGGVARGGEATALHARLLAAARDEPLDESSTVPLRYWSARQGGSEGGGLLVTGAVLVLASGRRAEPDPGVELPAELADALRQAAPRPGRALLGLLRADGALSPSIALGGLAVAALGSVIEALLFRGMFDLGARFPDGVERAGAAAAMLALLAALLLLELPLGATLLAIGRRLETRLRMALLEKIPRLPDRYFRSRPVSDMAERAHGLHGIRDLSLAAGEAARAALTLVATTAAIVWFDPPSAPLAIAAGAAALLVPLAGQRPLVELDLRVRTHRGGLARFYLDALLGLVPLRAHAADRVMRREHEARLLDWARASGSVVRTGVWIDALLAAIGFGLAAALLHGFLGRGGEPGAALLLAYWALLLPALGDELATAARQAPTLRNLTLRALEPLGAPTEDENVDVNVPVDVNVNVPVDGDGDGDVIATVDVPSAPAPRGVAISLSAVSVVASGHTLLDSVTLDIAPGEHIAIVGRSGAGKSTLLGLLLGWHRAAAGELRVDGAPLDGAALARLRAASAWIDPAVQLWNQTLLDNLRYGTSAGAAVAMDRVLADADLIGVVNALPDGLQTSLGEAGALVSGGEGQRVRLGRALHRAAARLVLLDEPFRGLERPQRQALLERARAEWSGATLLCATHDVGETRRFSRVLVVDGGRVVEDLDPAAAPAASRYAQMLADEEAARREVWGAPSWHRLTLAAGKLEAGPKPSEGQP